jgi:hypothetical protein
MIRFLLDENVDKGLRSALRRRHSDMVVWCVGDPGMPPIGTKDPEILTWCETHRCCLVTNNRASMPGHLRDHLDAGHEIPGIFTLNPDMSMGEMVEELILIWGASDSDEYSNFLLYLPLR